MQRCIVFSASIMVPRPWFAEFAAYARKHPKMDFGGHPTLNCEWENYRWGPFSPRDKVSRILDNVAAMVSATRLIQLTDHQPNAVKHYCEKLDDGGGGRGMSGLLSRFKSSVVRSRYT